MLILIALVAVIVIISRILFKMENCPRCDNRNMEICKKCFYYDKRIDNN